MATLKFENINKVYDNGFQAVYDFNLEIKDREFIVFVGPSGCGKSTTLRMVAGLEDITFGNLYIDGKVVNEVLPKDRDIAMVFQNYALFPHMTVFKNIAFGLRVRKVNKDEIKERVEKVAEVLGLTEYLNSKPGALSGGQRQRVALGRAIVGNPKVFLMDEPLSNLDAKLRIQMRTEIIAIHERVKATTIYVTHDQTEAMTMADRIVIMKSGVIQQIGTPREVYNNPENIFVGGFIGAPTMNFFNGKIQCGKFVIDGESNFKIDLTKEQIELLKDYTDGKPLVLGVRPENVYNYNPNDAGVTNSIPVDCKLRELLGSEIIGYGEVDGQKIACKTNDKHPIEIHDTMELAFDVNKMYFFDKETEKRIRGVN